MRPYVFSQHRHFFHFRAAQQMWSGTHIYFMLASKYWSTYKYLNAPNAPPKSFLTAEPSISNLTSEHPFKYQSDEEGEEKSRKLREAAWVRIAAQRHDGKWADICYYENGKTQRLRSIWKICNYCLKHDIKFEPYIFVLEEKINMKTLHINALVAQVLILVLFIHYLTLLLVRYRVPTFNENRSYPILRSRT